MRCIYFALQQEQRQRIDFDAMMHYHHLIMRTTLDIDEDILAAAKELAAKQKVSAGKVLSDLARKALVDRPARTAKRSKGGFALVPDHGQVVTAEFVERLLNETE